MCPGPSAPSDETRWLILVVEDDWLIASDLASTLEENGFEVLGPALSVAAALRLLDNRQPDVAVLDVNLGHDLVTPVARRLQGHGIPFVLASGWTSAELSADELLGSAPNVGKPTVPRQLIAVLNRLLEPRNGGIPGEPLVA